MSNAQPGRAMPPRQSFPPGASWVGLLAVLGAVVIAGFASVLPGFRTQEVAIQGGRQAGQSAPGAAADPGVAGGSQPGTAAGAAGSVAAGGGGGAAGAAAAQHQCAAGRNGGATDTGVTATSIKLASTVVESGIGEIFLGDVRFGMIAEANAVNRAGGVCGRKLDLQNGLVDDGWDGTNGETYIRNFINQGVFALPVEPSSEGLDKASLAHDIDKAGIPVVGSDGMLHSQYADPWIWPVSTSTISTAHIAVKSAYDKGARSFGIVWDQQYRFGVEGHNAFKGAISRLPGATLAADVGVDKGQQDYSSPGSTFNNGCGSKGCDMVFVLLEPNTAETWFSTSGMKPGNRFTEGPQPLFVDTFGQNCGAACNNMVVWTSYYPPRAPFDGRPDVARYVAAIRSVSASADVDNQFLEGGYDGMLLFVKALQTVGPDLTRQALRQVLDSTTFDSGLSRPLTWRPGNHFANTAMLGFSIQYSQGFNGFQYTQSDWVQDPWPTLDQG
jgi:ABC-type branched-subunit amino acid transport system substrate-binding protein